MSKHIVVKIFSCIMVLAVTLSLASAPLPASAGSSSEKPPARGAVVFDPNLSAVKPRTNGTVDVMLELQAPPTSVVYTQALKTNGLQALAVSSSINAFNQIKASQQGVIAALAAQHLGASVLYQVHAAYNGVAITIDFSKLNALKTLPGVKAVHALIPKTVDNASSVPEIGAPEVWPMGLGTHGDGIKIGVIDTGIDYLHTDFGGPGTGYDSIDFTKVGGPGDPYPTVKVAGGYDFAGDDYDANTGTPPAPDLNPMDCYGHGTHVAGTIAGYGVESDGFTYTGSYGPTTDFMGLEIGPGVAPEATLYSLRVFGCQGSTNLVTKAIDWALDPNSDGDPSDHLDVINMSLGSDAGSAYDPDAVASDNASLAGMIVVASAGNAGNTDYVVGTPSVANRAISVAASIDPLDVMDGFQVTAPKSIAKVYGSSNSALFPWTSDYSLTGNLVYPSTNVGGCAAFPAGTFTGKIAFLDWTFNSDGVTNECGSIARTGNAQAAGAIGVVIRYLHPYLDIAINGSAIIPATITTLATGNILKQQLDAGKTVTVRLTGEYMASVKNVDPKIKDMEASFSSRGARRIDNFLKPDIAAPGMTIFSADYGTGTGGVSMSGTSMAAPHVTGVMALLREIHPTWSVEELKALVMNTATHDLSTLGQLGGDQYGLSIEGAGRVDVANASQSQVVAYNAEDAGTVSLSFGEVDVAVDNKNFEAKKTFVLENKGGPLAKPVTYKVAFSPASSWTVQGVGFSVFDGTGSVKTVTVAPGENKLLTVKMTVDGTALRHVLDKTMTSTQAGFGRSYTTEAGGFITFTPTSGSTQKLRLPVYALPRPVASMQGDKAVTMQYPSGTTEIQLSGVGINTGTDYPTDITSLVSAFELKYTGLDKKLGPEAASANIQYVGAMSDIAGNAGDIAKSEVFFGISTFGKWTIPSGGGYDTEFDIYIDTTGDSVPDYMLVNLPLMNGVDPTDVFVSGLFTCSTTPFDCTGGGSLEDFLNYYPGDTLDTNLDNNNVIVIPVYAGDIGLDSTHTTFNFWIGTSTIDAGPVDTVKEIGGKNGIAFDAAKLAVDTTGGKPGIPLWKDLPGKTIPVDYNFANAGPSGIQGVLLLHHHNGAATTAQIVKVSIPTYLPIVANPAP